MHAHNAWSLGRGQAVGRDQFPHGLEVAHADLLGLLAHRFSGKGAQGCFEDLTDVVAVRGKMAKPYGHVCEERFVKRLITPQPAPKLRRGFGQSLMNDGHG